MTKIKTLFKTIYSYETIDQLKNTKLSKSFLILTLYCLLLNFALGFSVVRMKTINPTIISESIYTEINEEVITNLPNCVVKDQQLNCVDNLSYSKDFSNFNLIINSDHVFQNNKPNIVFKTNEITIMNSNNVLRLDYENFENFAFGNSLSAERFVEDLTSRLFITLKPMIIFPAIMTLYFVVIVFDFIFVLSLALVGLLFNISSPSRLSYKQLLNLVIYSSLTPTIISLFVSLLLSPIFGVVVFNFSLAIFFIYIYKKVGKGNFSQIELTRNFYT